MSTADDLTPAERYADFRRGREHPVFRDFESLYSFPLDDFQARACHEIEEGRGVLVAAPTGSGKTIVGEFAIHLALATGRKCFYTTPIKALSNQKYNDLVARYGPEQVGLLTGDNVVNGEAPIVVMTTEVLRNMLYAGSRTLLGLGFVVMDEVHYLADRARGAVWEEVIIHLPESVSLVSLSATVSNAEEFGEWLETVRGDTTTIVEEKRPVPLYQHVMVGKRLLDLFADSDVDAAAGFVKEGAPVNNELLRIARDDWASSRMKDRRSPRGRSQAGGRGSAAKQVGNGRRVWIPSRADVIDRLDRQGLLPAIVFIFSRVGCDAAVTQCLNAGVRLTTPEERDEIYQFVEASCRNLPEEDLHVLGYHDFLDGLTRGIAAHHAGMLPAFKQCVEELYVRGLCKVVFATETLALGINMPARTVVIEKLSKWNGETHADITPGEYTQLTGRAGRRGLDVEGHGVVLWQPGMNPREVAGLASTRTYPLRSSFRPSYNMAVNLVHQFGRERSRELLEQSFAQFQADKAVVGLARQLRKSEDALEGYREAATCHLGDFMEYAALRRRIGDAEKAAARSRREDRREEVLASLALLKPGDVIEVPAGKFAGYAVVVDPGHSAEGPRPYVVTADRQARRLALMDFPTPVEAVTRLRVCRRTSTAATRRCGATSPRPCACAPTAWPRRTGQGGCRQGAHRLRHRARDQPAAHGPRGAPVPRVSRPGGPRQVGRAVVQARPRRQDPQASGRAAHQHRGPPVRPGLRGAHGAGLPRGRHGHLAGALPAPDLLRHGPDRRRVPAARALGRPHSLRACCGAVGAGVRGAPPRRRVLAPGARGSGARRDRRDGAAVGRAGRPRARPQARLPARARHGLRLGGLPVGGGRRARRRAGPSDLAAGDFVRWMKQLLDLAGQVADAAGDLPLRSTAREVVKRLKRGVVAYSGLTD